MKHASVQFDSGISPRIACVNQATVPLGVDFDALIAALNIYVSKFIAPVWGCSATLMRSNKIASRAWNMVFLDNADAPGALAYHDLTADGFPILKVFVKTTLADNALVSVSASHELVEALIDPACQLWADGPGGHEYAYESADAVEETDFPVNGIRMSNFVFPAWFESFRKTGPFDQLGKCTKPFQLLSGGYSIVRKSGKVSQVFGTEAKRRRFAKEDRRQHRSEYR
jgi:hypothetical protein